MLKITKGLKKKKKGKKSKHKEEELFKPEELEAYRREHQQQSEKAESSGVDDEWKKFSALTADIDSVLRKTQDDLDRIKSTSFFQRVPPPSELKKAQEEAAPEQENKVDENRLTVETTGVVELSETESEEEEVEDDIFDTSFVDAVASGEVKLAYIPESPTKEELGDDPFDTSIAERAILGPAFNKKGKKLVPLGAAVEVLTGRVELPTCAIARRPVNRRGLQQQKDLLLGSFDLDDNGNTAQEKTAVTESEENAKSLLDDDAIPLDAPIDLSVNLTEYHPVTPQTEEKTFEDKPKDIINEFDVLKDDEDDEFALLAAESVTKKPTTVITDLPLQAEILEASFDVHFEETEPVKTKQFDTEFDVFEADTDDPFDTTFAENILPGKAELKIIEDEILNTEISEIVEEKFSDLIISKVSIHVTNPTGERESISSLDRVDESSLNSIKPYHRDLLGGSNTDLSKIGDEPIQPTENTVEESFSDYSDPFDTSSVDQISAPGQAELKFLEKELLGDQELTRSLSDDDFNPRESEPEKTLHRPDILEVHPTKIVTFVTPSQPDLLGAGDEHTKYSKPLTPYYVRENSIPEQVNPVEEEEEVVDDPFDTSFVADLAPGKAELKLIESEFGGPPPPKPIKRQLSDEEFDPRAEFESAVKPERSKLPELPLKQEPKPDLLAVEDDVSVKVLTPAVETVGDFEELSYSDPFDTSIACNILPGKAELRLLENELISEPAQIKRNLTDPEFDPRFAIEANQTKETLQPSKNIEDIFGDPELQNFVKPLTPYSDDPVAFQIGEEEEIDPFDTSIADNIAPGRAELKLLESELI